MAQISKRLLNKKVSHRIFEIFTEVISTLNKPTDIQDFLDDLLSPTEKIMLAKRLTIAYLLLKGYKQRSICSILKVSLSTVNKVSTNLQTKGRGYKEVIGKLFTKNKLNQILDKLDTYLFELLPPTPGTNWSERKRRFYEEKKQKRKLF